MNCTMDNFKTFKGCIKIIDTRIERLCCCLSDVEKLAEEIAYNYEQEENLFRLQNMLFMLKSCLLHEHEELEKCLNGLHDEKQNSGS